MNVLITRAREKIVVFSSMCSDDIDPTRTNAVGVAELKKFLAYAETGNIEQPNIQGDREMDSPFEEAVAEMLRRHGYEVIPQVGVAGFYIDLAVPNPDRPGQLILGIECDGATYHSSRSARDRDRLREEVLVDLGWRLHRIWSTDWFMDRDREIRKLLDEIEHARTVACSDTIEVTEAEVEETPIIPPDEVDGPVRDLSMEDARAELFRLREKIRQEVLHAPEEGILRGRILKRLLDSLPETEEEFMKVIPGHLLKETDERTRRFIPEILQIIRRVKR